MPPEITAEAESAAPAEQEAASAPATPEGLVESRGSYRRWEFPTPESDAPAEGAPETAEAPGEPEGDKARQEEPPAEKPKEGESEGEGEPKQEEPPAQPSADDLSDEELALLDRALTKGDRDKLPKAVRDRIDQLVNNRYGNQLQQARQQAAEEAQRKLESERQAWDEATAYYRKLEGDDEFYSEQVKQHGQSKVRRWMADYEDYATTRTQARRGTDEATQRQFTERFNEAAIGEFQSAVKSTLPFYNDLPEDTRQAIESAKYDPEGNWFADSLETLSKGVQKHIDRMEREHQKALEEAREAGRNEALGDREDDRPVNVQGQKSAAPEFKTFRDVERAYAEGSLSNAEWERQKTAFGIDY